MFVRLVVVGDVVGGAAGVGGQIVRLDLGLGGELAEIRRGGVAGPLEVGLGVLHVRADVG